MKTRTRVVLAQAAVALLVAVLLALVVFVPRAFGSDQDKPAPDKRAPAFEREFDEGDAGEAHEAMTDDLAKGLR